MLSEQEFRDWMSTASLSGRTLKEIYDWFQSHQQPFDREAYKVLFGMAKDDIPGLEYTVDELTDRAEALHNGGAK